jgi:hypothetical protein
MIPALTLDGIKESLTFRVFGDDGSGERPTPHQNAVMVGLLFAPPSASLAKREVLPSLEYFHCRAGKQIDFFCAGYTQGFEGNTDAIGCSDYKAAGLEGWVFSNQRFVQLCREISEASTWKYSGETELVLTNAKYDPEGRTAVLDFSTAILFRLDQMKHDKAIASVREFFEKIFQFAESTNASDPTWTFSDKQGLKQGRSAFMRFLLSLLPKSIAEYFSKAKHYAVVNVSRAGQ